MGDASLLTHGLFCFIGCWIREIRNKGNIGKKTWETEKGKGIITIVFGLEDYDSQKLSLRLMIILIVVIFYHVNFSPFPTYILHTHIHTCTYAKLS